MTPAGSHGQVQVAAPTRSTTLGRELFSFGFGGGAGSILPPFVTHVRPHDAGPLPVSDLQIVMKDGQRMLKASHQVGLLISLAEELPRDFTIEFDIVPKPCCQPADLSFEGARTFVRGPESAEVQWHHTSVWILGGGNRSHHSANMPKELDGKIAGQLTKIVFEVRGDQMRIFTNGVQMVPDPPPTKFGRKDKVIRVLLGGDVNDVGRDVYLARMRVIADSPVAPVATAPGGRPGAPNAPASPGRSAGPRAGGTPAVPGQTAVTQPSALGPSTLPAVGAPVETAQNTSGVAANLPPAITGFTVGGLKPWGVTMTWDDVPNSETFELHMSDDNGVTWRWGLNIPATVFKGTRTAEWTGITPNATHQLRVIARDANQVVIGRSAAATYRAPALPRVTNLQSHVFDSTKSPRDVSWTWDPVAGIPKYLVSFAEIRNGTVVPSTTGRTGGGTELSTSPARFQQHANTTIRACVAPLPPSVSNQQAVMAGAECSEVTFTTKVAPSPAPSAPLPSITGFTVQARTPWGLLFDWDDDRTIGTFEVQSSRDGAQWNTLTSIRRGDFLQTRPVPFVGLTQDETYLFRVIGVKTPGDAPLAAATSVQFQVPRIPNVNNLKAAVGTAVLGASGGLLYPVTWSWDLTKDATKFVGQFYEIRLEKNSGQLTTTPVGVRVLVNSGMQKLYVQGTTMRLCVAPEIDRTIPWDELLAMAACADVSVP